MHASGSRSPARTRHPSRLETGRIQDLSIRIHADHADLHAMVQQFLAPLIPVETPPTDTLELFLRLCRDPKPNPPAASGPPAKLQFVNVSCFGDAGGPSYRTRDGSELTADIAAGQARGTITRELMTRRHAFTDLLLAPLMEMLKHRGYYGLHAATVTRDDSGYLFPATAGQGKTTVALGLLREGFQYVGDDKVLLREEAGGITALAFTRRFNIDPDIGDRYRELDFVAGLEPLPLTDKRAVDVSTVYPGSFTPRCRPRFIIHLQRAPRAASRIVPLSRFESFGLLVRQTILALDRTVAARQLALLGRLLQSTRSYLLYNGDDLYGDPERLAALLPRA